MLTTILTWLGYTRWGSALEPRAPVGVSPTGLAHSIVRRRSCHALPRCWRPDPDRGHARHGCSPAWAISGLIAVVLGNLAGLAADALIKIKMATLAPKGSSIHQILQQMGEKWRQAPDGGAALTIFTDGTMGGEADMVRKMRIGQIQAAALTVVGLSEIEKSVSALQFMPMMFRSWNEVDYVVEKLGPRLEKGMLDKGFVMLSWSDAGWVKYFSKEPLLYPDDLKKMKLFAWAGNDEGVDLLKGLGYRPVSLETADILPGLQTGLINVVPSVPVYANAGQFYNLAPHMLDMNWAPVVAGAVISKKAWEKIPSAMQEAMRRAAIEAGRKISERSRKENDEAVEAMQKRGLKVQPLTRESETVWRKNVEEAYPRIRGKLVPADMFDEVLRLLQEYRATGAKAAQ